MSDDVIPLDEIGKIETVKVYNQAYVDKLEKENAELEEKLANADYQLEGRDNKIIELEAQIEKMKNCKNCKKLKKEKDGLLFCTVGSFYTNAFGKNCDKWEIKEE